VGRVGRRCTLATHTQAHLATRHAPSRSTLPLRLGLVDAELLLLPLAVPPAHGTTSHSNASATGSPQAKIDVATGKITRVVDIAEAPWRVIGLLLTPVVSVLVVLGEFYLGTGRTPGV